MLTSASFGQVRDYDPSTGDQWELGSKFDFLDGRGSATLAAYRIVRRDFSVADPNNPNLSVPVGQQTSRGIEAAASLRITPKLLAEGNFAWVDAQYDEFTENVGGVAVSRKGKTPPNVPERVGNLWLTYDFDPAWQGGWTRATCPRCTPTTPTPGTCRPTVTDFPQLPAGRAHADHRARAQPHRRGLRALRAEHAAVLRRRPAHLRAERADALLRSRR